MTQCYHPTFLIYAYTYLFKTRIKVIITTVINLQKYNQNLKNLISNIIEALFLGFEDKRPSIGWDVKT